MLNKKYYLILSFIISVVCFGYSQNWENYPYDSLGFSIDAPRELIKNVATTITDLGVMQVVSYGLTPKDKENLMYQVIIIEYPEGSFPKDSIEWINEALNDLVKETSEIEGNELIYSEEITQQSVRGIQWRIHAGKEIAIKAKGFLHDDKMYIIQVMSNQKKSLNLDVAKFMDSFKFIN